jgi:hypothetical protein
MDIVDRENRSRGQVGVDEVVVDFGEGISMCAVYQSKVEWDGKPIGRYGFLTESHDKFDSRFVEEVAVFSL